MSRILEDLAGSHGSIERWRWSLWSWRRFQALLPLLRVAPGADSAARASVGVGA